jgi:RNA polymerase sigma-70 factor (ECF subfamily)
MPQPTRSQLDRMQAAIRALPEPTRTVYRLHLIGGLDYEQIGARLLLSTAEVEHHLARAIVIIDRVLRRAGGPRHHS